jgi:hypothetical protein
MYDIIETDSAILFSDLHGNHAGITTEISRLIDRTKVNSLIFLGDAIDHWYSEEHNGALDPNGDRLMKERGLLILENFSRNVPYSATSDIADALECAFAGNYYRNFPPGTLRRAIVGAVLSYETLAILRSLPGLTFILGNHEIDLLSGTWVYRSLQKSFLCNILGAEGLWCLELRDLKQGRPPMSEGLEIALLRSNLLSGNIDSQGLNPLFSWLFNCPIAAEFSDWLLFHGGPTIELNRTLPSLGSPLGFKADLEAKRKLHGFAAPLFSEVIAQGETFTEYGPDHFAVSQSLLPDTLRFFGKTFLAVGHSPYIGTSGKDSDPRVHQILRVSDTILKLDVGLKINPSLGHHYALVSPDEESGYHFSRESNPERYNLGIK